MSEMKVPRWLRSPKATAPSWLRALGVVSGFICVVLAIVLLSDQSLDELTRILILVTAILVFGVARIVIGLFGSHIPLALRAFNVVIGVSATVITLVAMIMPSFFAQTLIQLLAALLLIHGSNSVIIGAFVETLPGISRGILCALGLLSIALSVVAFLISSLPLSTSISVVSAGYLSNGITQIVEAASKMKSSK